MDEYGQSVEQQDVYDARVIRDHVATQEYELNLRIGEEVHVMEEDASGWAGGFKIGDEDITGWFPKYCLERKPRLRELPSEPCTARGGRDARDVGGAEAAGGSTGGSSCTADRPGSVVEAPVGSPLCDIRAVATPQGPSPQRLQQQQITELQQQLQQVKEHLQRQASEAAGERARLGEQLAEAAAQLSAARAELVHERERAQHEAAAQDQQRCALQQRLDTLVAEAERRSQELEARLAAATLAQRGEEDRRVAAERTVEELRAEVVVLRAREGRSTAARDQLRISAEEVEALRRELMQKESQLEAAEKQRLRLLLDVEGARAQILRLEDSAAERPPAARTPQLHSVHSTRPAEARTPDARAVGAAMPAPLSPIGPAPAARPAALATPSTIPACSPPPPVASPWLRTPSIDVATDAEAKRHRPDPTEAPRAGSVRAHVRKLEQRVATQRHSSRGPCPRRSGPTACTRGHSTGDAAMSRVSAPAAPWHLARTSVSSLSRSLAFDDDEVRPYCDTHLGMMPLQRDARGAIAAGNGGRFA